MTPIIDLRGICKTFAQTGTVALDHVTLTVNRGEVHALVGQNGAGKTTLMNILFGLVAADSGEVVIDGERALIRSPQDAYNYGIGMVHQHFKLVPSFTVAENVMLGVERARVLHPSREAAYVRVLSERFGLPVEPGRRVADLTVGMQQRVEILKALVRDVQVLIMDEPTAVIGPHEVESLHAVIRNLRDRGITIIYITHRLPEVTALADRLTVLRGGRVAGAAMAGDVTVNEIAAMMMGERGGQEAAQSDTTPHLRGETVLEARNVLVMGTEGRVAVDSVSLAVHRGEIVGLLGVSGNGQDELVEALTGLRPVVEGAVVVCGEDVTHCSVRERRRRGMAHISADRLHLGLNVAVTPMENVVTNVYATPEGSWGGFLRIGALNAFFLRIVKCMSVAISAKQRETATLSGGNLQKLILGRETEQNPDVVIANQPARGLDFNSVEMIQRGLTDLRRQGSAILLVSGDIDEVLAIADRIAVIYGGKIAAVVAHENADHRTLREFMAGISDD